MKRQKALVTGSTGFSGGHLIRYLETQSVDVTRVSLRGDHRTDAVTLGATFKKTQPDYIFHLAGVAGAVSAREYFEINVLCAEALLRGLQQAGLEDRPVLLIGTAAEYGIVTAHDLPVTEETPCRPYNLYGISKLTQSLLGLAAAIHQGRSVIVARPFNIIGSNMPEHLALASFLQQIAAIKAGTEPPVLKVGNLDSARDFIDIRDVVRIYWLLVQNKRAYGRVLNLCTGIPTTLRELLDRLIEASGVQIDVQSEPSRFKPVEIPVHYGSNRELHKVIGEFSYTPISDIISEIVR